MSNKCIGCLNLNHFPFSNKSDNKFYLDHEGCWYDEQGNRIDDEIEINYCPICGRKIN